MIAGAVTDRTVRLDEALYRTDCGNGLVVVTERIPHVRSAAAGVWFRTASGHEPREKMGVSHLLEHLVFKGTERRTAREIALALEVHGGALDAFTSRDHTTFQAHVLDADLALAVDVLTDLVRHPLLREDDLALERNVVLEEINGVLDAPDDYVGELWNEEMWPRHPYGYSILGTRETVSALTAADLRALHEHGYYPGNAVIAVAGNIEHPAVVELLARHGWMDGAARAPQPGVGPAGATRGAVRTAVRELQQVHAIVGTDTVDGSDDRRWGLALLSAVIGGGMSSRLFQRVREQLGLCYAISAWHASYHAAGIFGVYVGAQPGTADRALQVIGEELSGISTAGVPGGELDDAKGQLKGNVILALESVVSRMNRLAVHVLNDERYHSIDDVLRLVDGVSVDEAAALAAEFLVPERMTTVRLGPA
ncbi:MAG: M16 family metallopeptidase [Gemmatimonadales bacterium]